IAALPEVPASLIWPPPGGSRSSTHPTGRPALLMVMTSEQPLCGAFNQNVLDFAERRWHEMTAGGPVHLVVVGRRGVRQIAARHIPVDRAEPAATSLIGLRDLAKRLAAVAEQRFAA